jgi:hypothetical protein
MDYDIDLNHISPQEIVRKVEVRPIYRHEKSRWDMLMSRYHYLGFHSLVGESIRYLALFNDHPVALLGWSAAALKCRVRDAWIGWLPPVQYHRLPLIANNSRFLIITPTRIPNLASRILSLNLKRLSSDWQLAYQHPLYLVETFVDPRFFTGTCYKAAGWSFLGYTRGFTKSNRCYRRHDHPKMVFVRSLGKTATEKLADPDRTVPLASEVKAMNLSLKNAEHLITRLKAIPDPRLPRGLRHKKFSVLAITICAILCGARSFAAIAQWAKNCSQKMLKRLECRYDHKQKRFLTPSEPTIRRFAHAVDVQAVDQAVYPWLQSLDQDKSPVAVDGKVLRGARQENGRQIHLLSAFLHKQGMVLAQCQVEASTNEIPKVVPLLKPVPLDGRVITLDALHTQEDTARFIVKEKHADYLFTVKDNQPTLKQHIVDLKLNDFPPSTPNN